MNSKAECLEKFNRELLSEEIAFEAFNKERFLKQSLGVKLLIMGNFQEFEKIFIELFDNGIDNNLPFLWTKMQIHALLDMLLMVSYNFYSKIEGIKVQDIVPYTEISKIFKCTDLMEAKILFLEIIKRLKATEEGLRNENIIGEIFNYVNSNYTDPQLNLNSISEKFNIENSYISKMYKKNFGINIMESIHLFRITEAKMLLDNTNISISEISEKVGYYDYRTFSKFFKRMQGVTPSEYRKVKVSKE